MLNFNNKIKHFVISLFFCSAVVVFFSVLNDRVFHWFVIPVTVCGAFLGSDFYSWVTGELDPLDPEGIFAAFGLHFFFLAPLLHVYFGFWMAYVVPPSDWRPWLGLTAILNIIGLTLYYCSRNIFYALFLRRPFVLVWKINKRRFFFFLFVFSILSLVVHFWVLTKMGGLAGYILKFEEAGDAFSGLGAALFLSERFPLLVLLGLIVWSSSREIKSSTLFVVTIIFCFFVLTFLFSGLRGSRAAVVWSMAWGVGLMHIYLRPLSRRAVVFGIALLVVYSYGYGFYKSGGIDNLAGVLSGNRSLAAAESIGNRSFSALLLGDFGRSDVQAYLLYKLWEGDNFELALGKTYLGDVFAIVPSRIVENKPDGKVYYGTIAQYGKKLDYGSGTSSRIYGLLGESILNFGVIASPIAFILLSLLVSYVKVFSIKMNKYDPRYLMYPFMVTLCILFLISDLDNFIVYAIKSSLVPFFVIWISTSNKVVSL